MRAVVVALVALLISGIAAPGMCAGWEASPESRRACCQRAGHDHCRDQAKADDCCGGHEQGNQAASIHPLPAAVVHAHAILVPMFQAADVERAARALYSTATATRLSDAPHLLVPPLRI